MAITLTINGKQQTIKVAGDTPLLWILRDELKLTGTKYGCGIAQCGACTVHVNNMPRRSCVTPIQSIEGMQITTIEGLNGPVAEAVQNAWQKIDVPQCGFCQSGQVMSAVGLLNSVPQPNDEDIDKGMTGNICRCATYARIRLAIHDAAESLEE